MTDDSKDDENDVFEIDDFTAASEWERFIYRIEEIMGPHSWKLNGTEKRVPSPSSEEVKHPLGEKVFLATPNIANNNREQLDWKVQTESLNFANFNFILSHHKLQQSKGPNEAANDSNALSQALLDSFDISYDFPPRAHCLSRWYGIREFILLAPSNKDQSIDTESRVNLLWSSVGVALSNLKCQIPVFIQIGNWKRRLHYGMCIGGGYRTSFEMIHLQYTPHECNHVHGMIETFKAKIARPLTRAVHVSIRFTYIIKNWPMELCWPQPIEEDNSTDEGEIPMLYEDLPLGSLSEPVNDLQFAVSWPSISSDMLNDDANYSDLNPEHAPQWWLKVKCFDIPDVAMYKHLKSLLHLCKQSSSSTAQIVRSLSLDDIDNNETNVTHALSKLVEPSHMLQDTVIAASRRVMKTKLNDSPIPQVLLKETLDYLFPDANKSKEETFKIQTKLSDEQKTLECDAIRNRDQYRNLKSAPVNSLTYNLALCIFRLNYAYGGLQGVAHLWHEFVLEMRYRFENNILVPGLAQVVPNLNYCLIHQKLQMLNCCIQRRQEREASIRGNENVERKPLSKESASYKDFEVSHKEPPQRDATWNDLLSNIERGQEELKTDSLFDASQSSDGNDLLSNIETGEEELKTDSLCDASQSSDGNDLLSNIETGEEELKTDSLCDASQSSDDESDDEFFEAQEEISDPSPIHQEEISDPSPIHQEEISDPSPIHQEEISDPSPIHLHSLPCDREGVLEETDMKLLVVDWNLCTPVTQQPSPLTEDFLLEQQEVMTQLGTSEEAAKVRAQMQSASLVSDMEAFKAANPGCILEDFVRWYSPNDWIPGPETEEEKAELDHYITKHKKIEDSDEVEGQGGWECEDEETDTHLNEILPKSLDFSQEGHLSLRMRTPGNTWEQLWASTKPVPIQRQKRLFDDTKEAEKVLHFLSNLRPSELALNIFPVIIHASILRINKEADSAKAASIIESILKHVSRIQTPSLNNFRLMESIVKDILKVETILERMQSLRVKLYPDLQSAEQKGNEEIEQFIQTLLNCSEVAIKGCGKSSIGKIIRSLLMHEAVDQESKRIDSKLEDKVAITGSSSQKFPIPSGREYILRTTLSVPSDSSRPCPQRLFTVITPEEFRMAGSFTRDTSFI